MQGRIRETKGEVYFLLLQTKEPFSPSVQMHFPLPSPSLVVLTLWWPCASLGAGTATWIGELEGAASFSSLLAPRTPRSLSETTAA